MDHWNLMALGSDAPGRSVVLLGGEPLVCRVFGASTLEDTPLRRVADIAQSYIPQTPTTGAAWGWLSQAYASGAQGVATYFEGPGGYQGLIA